MYVNGLLNALKSVGVDGCVLAAAGKVEKAKYSYDGMDVYRYPEGHANDLQIIRGIQPHIGFDKFKDIIKTLAPDLFHIHSWTLGAGIHHLRFAKEIGLPAVLTIHTAGLVCIRGTMMRFGTRPCDGRIGIQKCGECVAHSKGIPTPLARVLSRLPDKLSDRASDTFRIPRVSSALATRTVVRLHETTLEEAGQLADRIVAVAEWLLKALAMNNIPGEKLVLCRQGVPPGFQNSETPKPKQRSMRFGIFGRADPGKGIHTAVKGFLRLRKETAAELHLHLIVPDPSFREYYSQLKSMAGNDQRIHFKTPVPRESISEAISQFDVILVPSECLETGPLIALEALAVGVPVYGSRLGGIEEIVADGLNGKLIEPKDDEAWGREMEEAARNPDLVERYRKNIKGVRTMREVADEMHCVYRELVS